MAKGRFGEVIAERSRHGGEAVGRNIFEYLKMKDAEISFFTSRFALSGNDVVCAVCGKKEPRAVFFFGFLARAASLCLAVVVDMPLDKVSNIVVNGHIEGLCVSDGVFGMADELDSIKPYIDDKEIAMYLSGIFGQIMEVSRLKLGYVHEPTESIRSAAVAVADFIGVDIDFDTYIKADEVFGDGKEVFDGRLCAACLLVFSAIARAYSVKRLFRLVTVRGMSGCFIELSFEAYSDGWQKAISYLVDVARSNRNLPLFVDINGTEVKMSVIPYYEDVGFVGVKGNETRFDLVQYKELF